MKKVLKIIGVTIVCLIILYNLRTVYGVIRWKMYIWLPDYISTQFQKKPSFSGLIHIIFMTVDHYEPGSGERGAEKNREWLGNYRKLADRHKDSYGRVPQHTWFYAYDHKNELVMPDLVRAVREGYGEIEFHWHHRQDNNVTFPAKLAEGIAWFNNYGAMIDTEGKKSFAFIHGDWSLDNARGEGFCGVTRELEILKSHGCYADFTFPAFGNVAQPKKVNSIYYAADDNRNKSYDTGENALVGRKNSNDLMIFEGPISLKSYGAIETDPYPDKRKIDSWIEANIHVQGRPEWIFIKTFTHGIQSKKVFFSNVTDEMFSYLEKFYGTGQYRLHYVNTREAYNIVMAAEDGMTGDPDLYLDYTIKKPICNVRRELGLF